MALSANNALNAHIAFQRFGLGPRPGDIDRLGGSAEDALLSELATDSIAEIRDASLPTYQDAAAQAWAGANVANSLRLKEMTARVDKHLDAPIGFVERLVIFWSNHFSMFSRKSSVIAETIGQFERDVIRKTVLGRFEDMLIGVMTHPAMIEYLDNTLSVGPHSALGRSSTFSYNENLGREVLELHTVGHDGGYTEQDVASLALILTGWSHVRPWESDSGLSGGTTSNRGQFIFRRQWHEPGPIELMGRSYPPEGMEQGLKALLWLANHPATAEHLSYKLLRHFITDRPTPAMVKQLADRYMDTGGDLSMVSRELLRLPHAFDYPLIKIRTPYELSVAQFRALGQRFNDDEWRTFAFSLGVMKNMVWEHQSPEGYSDETGHWLNPAGMTLRLETAYYTGTIYGGRIDGDIPELARRLYGEALSRGTLERVEAARDDVRSALAILFCSPEFQRR